MHIKFVGGMHGSSCDVYVDGEKLDCVRAFRLDAAADDIVRVTLELFPSSIEIDTMALVNGNHPIAESPGSVVDVPAQSSRPIVFGQLP